MSEDRAVSVDGSRPSIGQVVGAIPGLVRFAATATVRTVELSARSTVRVGSIVTRAAVERQPPGKALEEVRNEAAEYARRLLGVVGPAQTPGPAAAAQPSAAAVSRPAAPTSAAPAPRVPTTASRAPATASGAAPSARVPGINPASVVQQVAARAVSRVPWLQPGVADQQTLSSMFDALIDTSNDVRYHDESHPAYVRVLEELTPDEARILRLFAAKGPQSALDIRTAGTFGFGSKLYRPGITMIGAFAGVQEPERVPSYLNNLNRLGLIWFSREMIGDVNSYALLEAQPEVAEAAEELGGKRKIRNTLRSIELTAFGKNLCALCGLLGPEQLQARASLGEVSQKLPAPDER